VKVIVPAETLFATLAVDPMEASHTVAVHWSTVVARHGLTAPRTVVVSRNTAVMDLGRLKVALNVKLPHFCVVVAEAPPEPARLEAPPVAEVPPLPLWPLPASPPPSMSPALPLVLPASLLDEEPHAQSSAQAPITPKAPTFSMRRC
jgi:hypothetical protein